MPEDGGLQWYAPRIVELSDTQLDEETPPVWKTETTGEYPAVDGGERRAPLLTLLQEARASTPRRPQ